MLVQQEIPGICGRLWVGEVWWVCYWTDGSRSFAKQNPLSAYRRANTPGAPDGRLQRGLGCHSRQGTWGFSSGRLEPH